MKYLISIILIFLTMGSASASWTNICTVTVHPSQTTTCSDYTISSPEFNSPVKAYLYKGTLILDNNVSPVLYFILSGKNINETLTLSTSDPTYTSIDNNIQITASSFPSSTSLVWEYSQYNPSAVLTISKNPEKADPILSLSLTPEFSEYYAHTGQIEWTLTLSNTGSIDALNMILNYPNHTESINSLQKDKSLKYIFYTDVPSIPGTYTINTSVKIEMKTSKDYIQTFIFNSTGTTSIKAAPQNIFLYKTINSRIYTEKNLVTISLTNSGTYYITDILITDQFKSSGIQHSWRVDSMLPGTSLTYTYLVNTTQPGTFTSPAATTTFEVYGTHFTVLSETIPITVISMGKQVESLSVDELYVAPTATIIPHIVQTTPQITPQITPIPNKNISYTNFTPDIIITSQITPTPSELPTLPGIPIIEILTVFIVALLIIDYHKKEKI